MSESHHQMRLIDSEAHGLVKPLCDDIVALNSQVDCLYPIFESCFLDRRQELGGNAPSAVFRFNVHGQNPPVLLSMPVAPFWTGPDHTNNLTILLIHPAARLHSKEAAKDHKANSTLHVTVSKRKAFRLRGQRFCVGNNCCAVCTSRCSDASERTSALAMQMQRDERHSGC